MESREQGGLSMARARLLPLPLIKWHAQVVLVLILVLAGTVVGFVQCQVGFQ